ncbi:Fic family protein [Stanieria sp. NIES-3757]|nr:Fic family protein [Stanieria sp. NIES-3757]
MMRSGQLVKQLEGYSAFIPAPLPPNPPIKMDVELTRLLSQADRSLGRLDGATSILPNPDLFVAMYVRQEAVLSSQIEGTQSTLEDVLQYEIDAKGQERPKDVEEVVNYVHALQYGLERLQELPLCLRLIREIHAKLLDGVRGSDRTPGEFRKTQNWIGSPGCTLATATFIPPPVLEMHKALDNLEKFLHDRNSFPALIHCGLAHAQFETIHPFLDGNGRVGRLLITFLLCQREILQKPLLYLSHYLKFHRAEYYDRLMAVRTDGNWEGWLKFFLKGIWEVSESATTTARSILNLREQHRELIGKQINNSGYGLRLLDLLFEKPMINIPLVEEYLQCSYGTANKTVKQLEQLGLLNEITGWQRNRLYRYDLYLTLFTNYHPLN